MKVTVSKLKERGVALGISFPNILAGAVTEDLLKRLFSTSFSNVICLRNLTDFGAEACRRKVSRKIELYYCERQIIPDMKSPGAPIGEEVITRIVSEMFSDALSLSCLEMVSYDAEISDSEAEFTARFEKYEIPVTVRFIPVPEDSYRASDNEFVPLLGIIPKFFIYEYPAERILSDIGFEIFEKLELLGDMEMYLEAYDILSSKLVSGRVVREGILNYCEKYELIPTAGRLETLLGYCDYKYMQKKWKVLLRQQKRTSPTWNEALSLVLDFYGPIWKAICENSLFLEDWMFELRKFM